MPVGRGARAGGATGAPTMPSSPREGVTAPYGARSASTAIYFLITPGSVSRLHRLQADEACDKRRGGGGTGKGGGERRLGSVSHTCLVTVARKQHSPRTAAAPPSRGAAQRRCGTFISAGQ